MSRKSAKIASLIQSLEGRDFDPHYLGFFECFNQQLFFEAHEVLEELWLAQRGQPPDLFYKGLIQLAGAFVHVRKKREQPAVALLKLAQGNLAQYPAIYQSLAIGAVQKIILDWMAGLERNDDSYRNPDQSGWPMLPIPGRV